VGSNCWSFQTERAAPASGHPHFQLHGPFAQARGICRQATAAGMGAEPQGAGAGSSETENRTAAGTRAVIQAQAAGGRGGRGRGLWEPPPSALQRLSDPRTLWCVCCRGLPGSKPCSVCAILVKVLCKLLTLAFCSSLMVL